MSVLQGAIIIVLSSLVGFGSCMDIYSTVKYVFKKDDPDIKDEKTKHSVSEKWLEEIRARKNKVSDREETPALQIIPEFQESNFEKTDRVADDKLGSTQKIENVGIQLRDYKMQKADSPMNKTGVNSPKQSQIPNAPKNQISEKSKAKSGKDEKIKPLLSKKIQNIESPEKMSTLNGSKISQTSPVTKTSLTEKRRTITATDEKSKPLADNKLQRPESAVNNNKKISQTTATNKIQTRELQQIAAEKVDKTKSIPGNIMQIPESPVNTSGVNSVSKRSQATTTGKIQLRKVSETGKDGKTKTSSQSPESKKIAADNRPKRVETQALKTQMGEQISSKTSKPNRITQFQPQPKQPNKKHPSITLQNIQEGSVKKKVQYWNLLSSSESKETI